MRIVAIDFETANENRTSACALGLAWIDNGGITKTEEYLIRPREMRFLSMNVAIHGIRPKDVADAPFFADLWPLLAPRMEGALLLAHNAAFDISVLRHTLAESGLEWPACDYLCTVAVARKAWPDLDSHRLDALADHIGIALDHHKAGSDAAACGNIALAAAEAIGAADIFGIPALTGIRPGRLTREGYTPCKGGQAPRRQKKITKA